MFRDWIYLKKYKLNSDIVGLKNRVLQNKIGFVSQISKGIKKLFNKNIYNIKYHLYIIIYFKMKRFIILKRIDSIVKQFMHFFYSYLSTSLLRIFLFDLGGQVKLGSAVSPQIFNFQILHAIWSSSITSVQPMRLGRYWRLSMKP